jgi:cellobiose phosphorylase
MLLQCEGDTILVAPAVPKEWKDFSFRLRAHDDMEVSARFSGGKAVSLSVATGTRHSGRKKCLVLPGDGGVQRLCVDGMARNHRKDLIVK